MKTTRRHPKLVVEKSHFYVPRKIKLPQEEPEISDESDEDSGMPMDCEEYEMIPRRGSGQENVRNLLPVKNKHGLEYRSVTLHDETIEEVPNNKAIKENGEESKILVHCYDSQQEKLDQLKVQVAKLCTSVIEDPENSIGLLKQLITLLQTPNETMVFSQKSILSLSLLHVFCDILPGYKVRKLEEDDMNSRHVYKKETKKRFHYEVSLLEYYKKYIDCLHQMAQDMNLKKKRARFSETQRRIVRELGFVAIKCCCELLSARLAFNFSKNIINILLSPFVTQEKEARSMCCTAFVNVFKCDKLGEASFDIVKGLAKAMKDQNCVPEDILRTIVVLNVTEATVNPQAKKEIDMKKIRKHRFNYMSRAERRKDKRIRKRLGNELQELEVHENTVTVNKFQTNALNKAFWIYFHILKDAKKISLISVALEGLSRFSYLINVDFFADLNSVLCHLMESGNLKDHEKLNCMLSLITVLSGQSESLKIDLHKVYIHLYQILLNICGTHDVNQYEKALDCVNRMTLTRRKGITFNRILAFMKRMSILALHAPIPSAFGFLTLLRKLFLNVKGADVLLDAENMVGDGLYLPDIDDPEYCNSQKTALWELLFLKKHYNPVIKTYSKHVLHGCPDHGRLRLPEDLANSSLFKAMGLLKEVVTCHKICGFEGDKEPPKKKLKVAISSHMSSVPDDVGDLSMQDVEKFDFISSQIAD